MNFVCMNDNADIYPNKKSDKELTSISDYNIIL